MCIMRICGRSALCLSPAASLALVGNVRGVGLMRAIQLRVDAAGVVDAARDRGLLVIRTDEKVVRLLPALNIEAADIDLAVDVLDDVLGATGSETAP